MTGLQIREIMNECQSKWDEWFIEDGILKIKKDDKTYEFSNVEKLKEWLHA